MARTGSGHRRPGAAALAQAAVDLASTARLVLRPLPPSRPHPQPPPFSPRVPNRGGRCRGKRGGGSPAAARPRARQTRMGRPMERREWKAVTRSRARAGAAVTRPPPNNTTWIQRAGSGERLEIGGAMPDPKRRDGWSIFFLEFQGKSPGHCIITRTKSNKFKHWCSNIQKTTLTNSQTTSNSSPQHNPGNYNSQDYMFQAFSKPKKLIHFPLSSIPGSEAGTNLF